MGLPARGQAIDDEALGGRAGAGARAGIDRRGRPPAAPLAIETIDAGSLPGGFDATRRIWLSGLVYGLAGFGFAYVTAAGLLIVGGMGFDWKAALLGSLIYSWPIPILLALVCTLTWPGVALLMLGYAAALAGAAALLTRGTTIGAGEVATLWLGMNKEVSLLAAAILARPVRAVGPIVGLLTIGAALGALYILFAVYNSDRALVLVSYVHNLLHLGVYGTIALVLIAGAVPMVLLAWAGLRIIGRRYRAQAISDQTFVLDAVMLIFAISYGIGLRQKSALGLLVPAAGFLTYKLVASGGLWGLRAYAAADGEARQLLLLRVFSLGRRSGQLFDRFSKLWRHVGSIRMIAGPDLATSIVEPHEFLDFTAGRLQRRFINGPAVLEQRLVETAPRRDPDGRYRTASFFCHDDTWKMALARLARDSDAVLMDLRGFTPAARGCIYEIEELLDVVPLARIVFVVDRTTDERALAGVLAEGWERLGPASPNRAVAAPRLRLVRIDALSRRNIANLAALLAGIGKRHEAMDFGSGTRT